MVAESWIRSARKPQLGEAVEPKEANSIEFLMRQHGGLPEGMPPREMFPSSVVHQWEDFVRSASPTMIFLEKDGRTEEVPEEVVAAVRESFDGGRPLLETVLPDGRRVLFDFVRKLCIEIGSGEDAALKTSAVNWVDEDLCFYSGIRFFGNVDEDSVRYRVANLSNNRLEIISIRRCYEHSPTSKAFRNKWHLSATRMCGWYGGKLADVNAVANGGQFKINWQLLGAQQAHGRGVHLSPMHHLMKKVILDV